MTTKDKQADAGDDKTKLAEGVSDKGKAEAGRPPWIPIKSLRFRPGFALDMPGTAAASAIDGAAEPSRNQHHRVYLMPGADWYRIEYYTGGSDLERDPHDVRMVHASWASWVPFPPAKKEPKEAKK